MNPWDIFTCSDCPYLVSAAQLIQTSKSPSASRNAFSTLAEQSKKISFIYNMKINHDDGFSAEKQNHMIVLFDLTTVLETIFLS